MSLMFAALLARSFIMPAPPYDRQREQSYPSRTNLTPDAGASFCGFIGAQVRLD